MFLLILFLLGAPGGQVESSLFTSLEECEKARATLPAVIEDHNVKSEGNKILKYTSACLPLKTAPQGKQI